MSEFPFNKIAELNTADPRNASIIDGLVQLLSSWQYGLAQEAVCLAEFKVLATANNRDLNKINETLKWLNVPFKYHCGNVTKIGTLTKVHNDCIELLDEDGNDVVIDNARRLVPFELYNAMHKLSEINNEIEYVIRR